jgi:thioester reductase-like protein
MPRPGYDDVVLVTGFPSLYARKMVEEVLGAEPRSLVYTVVMPKFQAAARAEMDALPASARERVVMLEGDAAAMDLGLSGAEFRQVTREIDRIHHVAHASYIGVDRRTAHALNVGGAGEILELARAAASLRCLVFHSSASVSGDRTGVVYEEDLDCGQSFASVVDETRMRAEQLVRRAMRDVPIAVVRPTTLVGDSGTGEVDRFDGPYLLMLLIVATPADIAIPLPGKGDQPLNIVPIDYVVKASHAIGRHPAAAGRTFHLADPHPLSARRVFELVARAGGRRASRGYIPSNLAKALLRTPGIERFVRSPRAFVEQLAVAVRYDMRNTDQLLASTEIRCPPFEAYVDQLVTVVQERVRSRRLARDEGPEAEVDDPLS